MVNLVAAKTRRVEIKAVEDLSPAPPPDEYRLSVPLTRATNTTTREGDSRVSKDKVKEENDIASLDLNLTDQVSKCSSFAI